MTREHYTPATELVHKKELLQVIYGVYDDWVRPFPLACRRGCEACCTRSVTMTTLEGEVILDTIRRLDREKWLLDKLAEIIPGKSRPLMTTNQFAEFCLKQIEVDSDNFSSWDFSPCIFLADGSCSIYQVRPFGCRSFGSLVKCRPEGRAEIAPIHLTVNTVFSQVIEHFNSDTGYWSVMTDILHSLTHRDTIKPEDFLLPARPLPGFLLDPREKDRVLSLLKKFCQHPAVPEGFSDLIDNFMLI